MSLSSTNIRKLGELGRRLARTPAIETLASDVYATLRAIGSVRQIRIVHRRNPAAWDDCAVRDGAIELRARRVPPRTPLHAVCFSGDGPSGGYAAAQGASAECLDALEAIAPQIGTALTLGDALERMKRAAASDAGIAREAMRARDEERRRIARDLHDDLGQSLASLRLSLKLAEDSIAGARGPRNPQGAAAEIAAARESVSAMFDKIRSLSHTLYPRVLDTLGLKSAIRELAHENARQCGLDVRCVLRGRERPIAKETGVALYRCAQEALSNAIRHAGASRITMEILFSAGEVRLAVEDNGKGFDPAALYDSGASITTSGFWTIRQRIAGLGGAFRLSTARGRGTVVAMMVPLTRRSAAAKVSQHAKNSRTAARA